MLFFANQFGQQRLLRQTGTATTPDVSGMGLVFPTFGVHLDRAHANGELWLQAPRLTACVTQAGQIVSRLYSFVIWRVYRLPC